MPIEKQYLKILFFFKFPTIEKKQSFSLGMYAIVIKNLFKLGPKLDIEDSRWLLSVSSRTFWLQTEQNHVSAANCAKQKILKSEHYLVQQWVTENASQATCKRSFFFYNIDSKRACGLPDSKWSQQPMKNRNTRCTTDALPTFCYSDFRTLHNIVFFFYFS